MSFNRKKQRIVSLAFILIPLAVGGLSALLSKNGMKAYAALTAPPLAPPGVVFPIVWALLYILMGVGAAIVYHRPKSPERQKGLWLFGAQLVVNFFWSILFFGAGWRLFSLIWLVLLLTLVIVMYFIFDKASHAAAYLQIPYVLWLCFAVYLNFGIWFLNR